MNKILTIFACLALVMSMLFFAVPISAEDDIDQYCDNSEIADADHVLLFAGFTNVQTFTPNTNRLSSVIAALAGGANGAASFTATIYKGESLVASAGASTSFTQVTWITFAFNNVEMEIGETYRLLITSDSATANWIYSPSPCYSGGTAVVDDVVMPSADFGFGTYGHTVASESTDEDTSTTEEISDTSADTAETTSSIVKPTDLAGEYSEEDKAVKLTWEKSTTSTIDGYRIYRSTEKNKGYTRLASVKKAILEYSDSEDLEEGTFYYFVRAYDGNLESNNSSIVTVEVPAIEEDTVAEDEELVVSEKSEPTLWQKIIGPYRWFVVSGLIVVALGLSGLLYYLIRKRKITNKI